MEEFKTIERVTELFRRVNCIGNENCFFLAFKDSNKDAMKYGVIGGIVGGGMGGAAAAAASVIAYEAANSLDKRGVILDNKFDALLVNQTENGFGIIPLFSKGVMMLLTPEKLEAKVENFVFINNNEIEEIKIKDFNIFNKGVQTLRIKVNGKKTINLMVRIKEKLISYQEENFTRFMNKYKK